MDVILNKNVIFQAQRNSCSNEIYHRISNSLNLSQEDFYLEQDGKKLSYNQTANCGNIRVLFRLKGGKGGFGSMLRAIGAQIEKTTNREACRDLSGRRLRDINEEQRLKNWIASQSEREKEAAEKKKKKLEKLRQQPKHEFKDETYDKERSDLPEKIEDAVLQGLQASCSTKRPAGNDNNKNKKKKKKLWVDADLEDLSSSEGESETEGSEEKSDNSTSLVVHGYEKSDRVTEVSVSSS